MGFYMVLDKHGRIILHFLFVSFVLSSWIIHWAIFMNMIWSIETQYLKMWTHIWNKSPSTCSLTMQAKVGPSKAPGRAVSRRPPTKRSTSDTVLVNDVCQGGKSRYRRYRSNPLVHFGEKLYISGVHHLVFRVYKFKLPMITHYVKSIFITAGWRQSVIKRTSFNSSKFWREGRLAQSDLKGMFIRINQ